MKIVLPWPDKRLTPNAKRRKHWRSYAPFIKTDRETGCALTYEALGVGLRDVRAALAGEGPINLKITFYPPDRRHRDDDGMIGAFKHLRDGICDALAVNDRRFRPHYFFEEPCKPGRVEVALLSHSQPKQRRALMYLECRQSMEGRHERPSCPTDC